MSIILVWTKSMLSCFQLIVFFAFWFFFQSHFIDQFSHFLTNLRLQLHNSFSLNLNFCFLFLVLYCLETCVNCVGKCVTHKFTPLRCKFYNNKKIMSFYGKFSKFFHIPEPIFSKQFCLNLIFLFSALSSMVSRNMCKLRHKLKNANNLPELFWSWQTNPWYRLVRPFLF